MNAWEWAVPGGTIVLLTVAVCIQRRWIGDLQADNTRLRTNIRELRQDAWRANYGYGPRRPEMVRVVAKSEGEAIDALIADSLSCYR